MKKIVIVGALGYLGTELCKIYSGESWRNKIVALDNRFLSERVSQLVNWNIEFFQGHILDNDFLKKHLFDADIVHHPNWYSKSFFLKYLHLDFLSHHQTFPYKLINIFDTRNLQLISPGHILLTNI